MAGSNFIRTILGAMLGSGVVVAGAVALIPIYFPPRPSYEWVKAAVPPADCGENDTGSTNNTEPPTYCAARDENTIAICWDGKEYKNGGGGSGCTYKAITPDKCTGGGSKGIVWVCKRASGLAQK
jgi:hypothetical protein